MKILAAFIAIVALIVLASMVSTGLWYCVDDTLAEYLKTPELGELPFLFVWPITMLISSLVKGTNTTVQQRH